MWYNRKVTKILNGREIADFMKERQARQVRMLRQAHGIMPRLAIIRTAEDPVIDVYVRLKKRYGEDILVEVEEYRCQDEDAARAKIAELNADAKTHGIIIQVPLNDPARTDELVNAVVPEKDVDGLGARAKLDPATAMAINWLLAAYNIDLAHKKIVIVGKGRLVGAPLAKMWRDSGFDVVVCDKSTEDLVAIVRAAEVVVTATGVPGLITSDMLALGAVVVDAGTADAHGAIVGDLAVDVRTRSDLTLTPEKGGVGPLTVTALFDNVIRACLDGIGSKSK